MTEMESGEHDVVLNDVRIHYTIRGTGPVLIAHWGGPGMDARGWGDLARIDDFVTVVLLHPRGSGLSDAAPGDAYLMPHYVADLEALRLHLGLERPILLGWSHGGMVAQQYAFTYPESLSKLIIFETAAYLGEFLGDIESAVQQFRHQPWFEDSFAALQKEWAGEYETDEEMAQLWAREIKFYFRQFDQKAEAYHDRIQDLPLCIAPLKVFNEQEAGTMDLRSRLAGITVPTLVLVGRHDFITNVAMAEELIEHLPDARLEVFEKSGHFPHVEEPEKFYEVVKEFVFAM